MSEQRVVSSSTALCITLVRILDRTLDLRAHTSTTPSVFSSACGYLHALIYSPLILFRFIRAIQYHDFRDQHQIITVDARDDPAWLLAFVRDHSRRAHLAFDCLHPIPTGDQAITQCQGEAAHFVFAEKCCADGGGDVDVVHDELFSLYGPATNASAKLEHYDSFLAFRKAGASGKIKNPNLL
ncbi:hypothetical protein PLICRDRAFT_175334 [Plicaturopsis crispa FD-325 SS-3]|nr:hypothetical protein PLICRDRAFT_175334 [Plicaturopsis crispa FD-325 SS-3]